MRRLFLGLAIAGLAVLAPVSAFAGDQEVAHQIATTLHTSGKLKGYSIGVKVQDKTVWLIGSVTSPEQAAAAMELARQTPGVEQVVNKLAIKEAPSADASASTPGQSAVRSSHPVIGQPVVQANGQIAEQQNVRLTSGSEAYEAPAQPQVPASFGRATPRPFGQPIMAAAPQGMNPIPVSAQMYQGPSGPPMGSPIPAYTPNMAGGIAPARYDQPHMPGYAWPSYASYPNYASVTYPKQYSPTAWPFIGPFYPYPQVPLGWRKVSLEWKNGWWMLDFKD